MSETKEKTRWQRLLDAIVISALSSLIATLIGGIAFIVYSQAQTATSDIKDIKATLENMRCDIDKSSQLIINEIAPLKAEHESTSKRFDEISDWLKKGGEFTLPNRPSYEEIQEEEDDLKNKFNPIQQQQIPM